METIAQRPLYGKTIQWRAPEISFAETEKGAAHVVNSLGTTEEALDGRIRDSSCGR